MTMEVVCCPHCESVLSEYYVRDNGSEKCVCRHCGEWETESEKVMPHNENNPKGSV